MPPIDNFYTGNLCIKFKFGGYQEGEKCSHKQISEAILNTLNKDDYRDKRYSFHKEMLVYALEKMLQDALSCAAEEFLKEELVGIKSIVDKANLIREYIHKTNFSVHVSYDLKMETIEIVNL